jgi:hypothetical protein
MKTMTFLQTRLKQRSFALGAWAALGLGAAGCSAAQAGTSPEVAVSEQALDLGELASLCGLACPGQENDKGVEIKGVAEGNAAISGVASVDAFFAAVIKYQGAATGVAGGIKAQLDAIKGDFGIAANTDVVAGLDAAFKANLEAGFKLEAEPARCDVDVDATLEARARCEGEVKAPSAMISCKGSCEVDASAEVMCDAEATLECTFVPPDLKCSGTCQGTCSGMVGANLTCNGTCKGECMGTCSAYVKNADGKAECAGSCSGMCKGSCETELAAGAKCEGSCKGECTVTNPMGGCKGGIRAECKAKADASIMCKGKCEGEVTPGSAKVECEASAKAEAKMNVTCTPPRVALQYKIKAGLDAMARAKFEAALKVLIDARLPALKAEVAKANSVVKAGGDLSAAAGGALEGAFDVAGRGSLKTQFALGCALGELEDVGKVVSGATSTLNTQIEAAGKLTSMLKI